MSDLRHLLIVSDDKAASWRYLDTSCHMFCASAFVVPMRCWRCPNIFAIHISTTRLFELLIKANTFKCTQTQKTPTQAANLQLGFHSSHTDPSYTHSVRKMHRIAEATGEGSASRAQKQCAPIGALPDSARVLQSDDGGGAAAALRLGAKRRSAAQQMGATVAAAAACGVCLQRHAIRVL